MVSTIWPSSPMRTKALGTNSLPAACVLPNGRLRLSIRPPLAAALVRRKLRRDRSVMSASCGQLDGVADAAVGAATADVAGHCTVDVGIGRLGVARQQRRCRHDLARLAVATLDDLAVEPGLLDP